MQTTMEINWPLEAARILIPGLITVIVGLWITRSNERYKTELLRQSTKFQLNHPKRAEAAAELGPLIGAVYKALLKVQPCWRIALSKDPEIAEARLTELLNKLKSDVANLSDAWDKHELLFDKAIQQRFNLVIHQALYSVDHMEEHANNWKKGGGRSPEQEMEDIDSIIIKIYELQEEFRNLLAP